jgi:hypothetical protein
MSRFPSGRPPASASAVRKAVVFSPMRLNVSAIAPVGSVLRPRHFPVHLVDDVNGHVEHAEHVEAADALQRHDLARIGEDHGNVGSFLFAFRHARGRSAASGETGRGWAQSSGGVRMQAPFGGHEYRRQCSCSDTTPMRAGGLPACASLGPRKPIDGHQAV